MIVTHIVQSNLAVPTSCHTQCFLHHHGIFYARSSTTEFVSTLYKMTLYHIEHSNDKSKISIKLWTHKWKDITSQYILPSYDSKYAVNIMKLNCKMQSEMV